MSSLHLLSTESQLIKHENFAKIKIIIMRLGVKSMRVLVTIDTNTVNILEKTNNSENDPLQ